MRVEDISPYTEFVTLAEIEIQSELLRRGDAPDDPKLENLPLPESINPRLLVLLAPPLMISGYCQ